MAKKKRSTSKSGKTRTAAPKKKTSTTKKKSSKKSLPDKPAKKPKQKPKHSIEVLDQPVTRADPNAPRNQLYYGDNLDVLRRYIDDESVDLIYLDPPFNSNADYNVLFAEHDQTKAAAQIQAFEDTWTWDSEAANSFYEAVQSGVGRVPQAMQAFKTFLGESDMLAYLSMMAPRLIELHRALKPTGSIYLHCDPTASHYLKMLMDAVFNPRNYVNEIVWLRSNAHNFKTRYWHRQQDVILLYGKSGDLVLNPVYQPYGKAQLKRYKEDANGRLFTGRDMTVSLVRRHRQFEWRGVKPPPHRSWGASKEQLEKWFQEGRILLKRDGTPRFDGLKVYLDEQPGKQVGTVWTDIPRISNTTAERLGYPTQKPEALLERIIAASSNEGDVVLDPFCGCGTAIAVAEKLHRKWVGIDVTHLAINLIKTRLRDAYNIKPPEDYDVIGEPTSFTGAKQLAEEDPFQFQAWALGLVGARVASSAKKGADKGIDGKLFFDDNRDPKKLELKQVIFSVKGGNATVSQIRDLRGVLDRESANGAVIGVLITLNEPTKPMRAEAASAGIYKSKWDERTYARIQILTIEELLAGRPVGMPNSHDIRAATFKKAPKSKRTDRSDLGDLFQQSRTDDSGSE